MAGPGPSLRFGDRQHAAGAAVEGPSDAQIQAILGEAGFRARRYPLPEIPQAFDRGMAPQAWSLDRLGGDMIRKLVSGEYRLYSRKKNPKTGKRRNLGTFKTRAAAQKHERDVQYFKRH